MRAQSSASRSWETCSNAPAYFRAPAVALPGEVVTLKKAVYGQRRTTHASPSMRWAHAHGCDQPDGVAAASKRFCKAANGFREPTVLMWPSRSGGWVARSAQGQFAEANSLSKSLILKRRYFQRSSPVGCTSTTQSILQNAPNQVRRAEPLLSEAGRIASASRTVCPSNILRCHARHEFFTPPGASLIPKPARKQKRGAKVAELEREHPDLAAKPLTWKRNERE